jgi:hypothetical protein
MCQDELRLQEGETRHASCRHHGGDLQRNDEHAADHGGDDFGPPSRVRLGPITRIRKNVNTMASAVLVSATEMRTP